MKFAHLADLHLGKRYNEFSLIEDQKYILGEILKICADYKCDGVIIAGDVYDKSVPSAEAVELFDSFLNGLTDGGYKVFVVSGNHDSAERLAFGNRQMSAGGVYLSPVYDGNTKCITLQDGWGKLNVYLLPFIKPATVRRFFGEVETYTQAVAAAVEAMNVNTAERNILVAHQFVTGSSRSGSEEFSVGDAGNVDCSVFEKFDYVALGHIHGAQNVGGERVRYCGTPLKYSLSEASDTKSVTVVELTEKGSVKVETVPLIPLRDVREIRGTYEELTARSYYAGKHFVNDLIHVVLTDEDEVCDAFAKLRIIYPNVMSVRYDNTRTRENNIPLSSEAVGARSPMELFSALFEAQNNAEMTEEQKNTVNALMQSIWGDGE
ncbi:MAG: exonuclease SbcCD subunit D [Clostridia bacterium]|nr:exonuclease SbcCD subunit D [Clostridia bacterium]